MSGRARRSRQLHDHVAVLLLLFLTACESPSNEGYAPGVGEFMTATQMRHAKLWFAGQAGNWPLASYEVDEIEEGLGDLVKLHPVEEKSSAPLAEMVPRMTAEPLRALRTAIGKQDPEAFATAFDSLTQGCNTCHRATGFGFNVVARPSGNPFPNQVFEPMAGVG